MLAYRDGGKHSNLDCILPERFEQTKSFILLASLPWRIQVLYSLGKRPVRLRTRTPMLTVSLSVIGQPERLAKVMPQKRRKISTANPIEGCQLAAIAIQLVSQSSAEVHLYLIMNQSKHCQKTVLGSIILSCL
jgi:hypothetical protein